MSYVVIRETTAEQFISRLNKPVVMATEKRLDELYTEKACASGTTSWQRTNPRLLSNPITREWQGPM